nr:MAG TPA: hypothetical protein [Caudoviricetes sp.]
MSFRKNLSVRTGVAHSEVLCLPSPPQRSRKELMPMFLYWIS